jgi:hypothetical protein
VLAGITTFCLVGACVPFPMTVYVPDAQSGQPVYSTCSFNKAVPVGVELVVSGVRATVSVVEIDWRGYVELRLDVPAASTVLLDDGLIAIDDRSAGRIESASFPRVSLVDGPIRNIDSVAPALRQFMQPISAPLVGAHIEMANVSFDRHFWMAARLAQRPPNEFWLTLPAFRVNGVPARFPQLHFTRRTTLGVALMNC